jgi:hypothetical protein
MPGPSPDDPHPMEGFPQVGFLKPLVKNPHIVVGDYSYYDFPMRSSANCWRSSGGIGRRTRSLGICQPSSVPMLRL